VPAKIQNSVIKKSLWGVVLFYLLIAFEMLYMAGPFAAYFYGLYSPILNFFNSIPPLAALNNFFFPHIARHTSSTLINIHEYAGGALAVSGFAAFLFGACQIYYHKFARKGAVAGGIYKYIRHPQYASFALCGLGLLIVWPRVVNLLMFVTMLFVYYLLAKAEERECEERFGQSYIDYKKRTRMFLPFALPFRLPSPPEGKTSKALFLASLYLLAMIVSCVAAKAMTARSIDSLHAAYTDDSATIALCEMDSDTVARIMRIAESDGRVATVIAAAGSGKFLNYVLPSEWYAAEVPMNGLEYGRGHASPADYDRNLYKVIFTAVQCGEATGKAILSKVKEREPIIEALVDLKKQAVTQVSDIPAQYKYRGIPVAIY
jgi:protein-S-isoprenylcysteine O-methyltransferase Ste14